VLAQPTTKLATKAIIDNFITFFILFSF